MNKTRINKSNLLQSVKGKILVMGVLGIAVAVIVGLVGVVSINRNAKNSEVVSLVNEINVLQSENLANDALYQYYVDEEYLDTTLSHLNEMDLKANQLKKIASRSYSSSVDSIIEKVSADKSNYSEIKSIHSERGYDSSIGKYKEFVDASTALSDSFKQLVNNNDWMEIPWIDSTFGVEGTPVTVDGKDYTMVAYENELPVVGKRNNMAFRLGGTFTYKGDYFVKNVRLVNGSDELPIDLSVYDTMEKSGDGLADAAFVDFGGDKAIKVTGKYDEVNNRWEEAATAISIVDYDLEKYPVLKYEMYLDNSVIVPGGAYKYGGSISGVYEFQTNLEELDQMVAAYSKLVVEGKDVSSNLTEIEERMSEIEANIPKFTTDQSLAQTSLGFLEAKKALFTDLKAVDERTLAIKADNSAINAELSELCAKVQNDAVNQMNAVRASVTVIIFLVLVISVMLLLLILTRVSVGINKSVKDFSSAVEEIAGGNISARANAKGKDEFALFASSLNGFLDTLEGTIRKAKELTGVLADSGLKLEESASKTKVVAGEINETIIEISKGAGEQAKDIETSSQRVIDIGNNIREILTSVSGLSEKSDSMSSAGKEASVNMDTLNRSSDSTNEAFGRIVEQVNKTDESVGKIQSAVSLISSVANQINLLSLNASIEAARAGEAGKGFAVVASEISKLADQTNESTSIIEGIIKGLTEESSRTVETINEVTERIEEQKKSIDSTSNLFGNVSTGISYTREAISTVLSQAEQCEKSGEQVVDLMTNLSAISEENAASAETTSTAMTKLNNEAVKLAETSAELKELADNLKDDLEFFKFG